jgi:hypothetical protein
VALSPPSLWARRKLGAKGNLGIGIMPKIRKRQHLSLVINKVRFLKKSTKKYISLRGGGELKKPSISY